MSAHPLSVLPAVAVAQPPGRASAVVSRRRGVASSPARTPTLAPLAVALLLALTTPWLSAPARAQAAAVVQSYDLPAQPLGTTLAQIAARDERTLSLPAALLQDQMAPPVRGRYRAEEAMAVALAGSGLQLAVTPAGVWTVVPAPTPAPAQLSAVTVQGQTDPLRTEDTGAYTPRAQASSTRLPLSLRETPQTVTVITRQQIEDRDLVTLAQAMEQTPGVTNLTRAQGGVHYTARGFEMTANMVDGMPSVASVDTGYEPNLAFYDRVDVVRGAAGLVYGAGNPGGAVNLVRKRPGMEPRVQVALQWGRWRNGYVELDASTPLNASGSVRGRVVAAYQDRDTFVDDEFTRAPALYGIVEADVAPSTTVHLGGSHERWHRNHAVGGLPHYADGGDLGLPRNSRGMAPDWTEFRSTANTLFGGLTHQFDERWKLTVAGSFQRREVKGQRLFNARGAVDRDTGLGPAYDSTWWAIDRLPQENRTLDAMLSGSFSAWGREHEVVAGVSWWHNDWGRDDRWAIPLAAPGTPGSIFDFDPGSVPLPPDGVPLAEGSTRNSALDYYGVTRWQLTEPMRLILGARVASSKVEQRSDGQTTSTQRENGMVTPFVGLTYDLTSQWTAYASYAEIYRVQNTSYTASGDPLPPVTGSNYELGLKGAFHDGRLNTAVALFRIEERNRAQVDPDNLTPCAGSPFRGDCFVASGKVRGEGIDTEISGELLPGWDIVAGYTFVKTRYLRDRDRTGGASVNEGKAFRSTTPRHLFKLWTNYRLAGDWQRWSVGGGVQLQSDIYTDTSGVRVHQGGYGLWSLRVGYDLGDWRLGLNINNLFDKHYYQRLGSPSNGSLYGEPRSWVLSLRGTF